jgi:GNAT superfamily N-acetyltransferase
VENVGEGPLEVSGRRSAGDAEMPAELPGVRGLPAAIDSRRMAVHRTTLAERPELAAPSRALFDRVWPEHSRHAGVIGRRWDALGERFGRFQIVLVDEMTGEVAAQARSLPIDWSGAAEDLPAGIDELVEQGFALARAGGRPSALTAVAIEVAPERQGAALSRFLLEALRAEAGAEGLAALLAPLRPTLKHRYPLTPIERYARWTRRDGLPFDPWLRVHVRLGAEILGAAPRSMRIEGTVADWELWTGLPLPESGRYVFPHGLAPLEVDREADVGVYFEPGIWVRHPVP